MQAQQIRKMMHNRRKKLSNEVRATTSLRVAKQLMDASIFLHSVDIACYLSKAGELNTQPIIEAIWAQNKNCYLPIVDPHHFGQMRFMRYFPQSELILNRFGIKEPVFQKSHAIDPSDLDLVLVPLFAFDEKGNRLGSGGGYYDRAFSFLKETSGQRNPFLCGIAYDFQEVPALTTKEWDIMLHAVVTESKMVYFR